MSDEPSKKHNKAIVDNQLNSVYFNVPRDIRLAILHNLNERQRLVTASVCKLCIDDLGNDPEFFTSFSITQVDHVRFLYSPICNRNIKKLHFEIGVLINTEKDFRTVGQAIDLNIGKRMDSIEFTVDIKCNHVYQGLPLTRFFSAKIGHQLNKLVLHFDTLWGCDKILHLQKEFPHLCSVESYLYGLPGGYGYYKDPTEKADTETYDKMENVWSNFKNVKTLNCEGPLLFILNWLHGNNKQHVEHQNVENDSGSDDSIVVDNDNNEESNERYSGNWYDLDVIVSIRAFQIGNTEQHAMREKAYGMTIEDEPGYKVRLLKHISELRIVNVERLCLIDMVIDDDDVPVTALTAMPKLQRLSIHFMMWKKPYMEQVKFFNVIKRLESFTTYLDRSHEKIIDYMMENYRPKQCYIMCEPTIPHYQSVLEWIWQRKCIMSRRDCTICDCEMCSSICASRDYSLIGRMREVAEGRTNQ